MTTPAYRPEQPDRRLPPQLLPRALRRWLGLPALTAWPDPSSEQAIAAALSREVIDPNEARMLLLPPGVMMHVPPVLPHTTPTSPHQQRAPCLGCGAPFEGLAACGYCLRRT